MIFGGSATVLRLCLCRYDDAAASSLLPDGIWEAGFGAMEDWLRNIGESLRGPDKESPWVEIRREGWSDIHEFMSSVEKLANMPSLSPERAGFLFRGQASDSWSLRPSLWRLFEGTKSRLRVEDVLTIEFDSIRYYQSRARSHLPSQLIPHENDVGAWLTLMQHYRAPTRMLDWTTSLNVALYFAAVDCCIEIHDTKLAQQRCARRENQNGAVWFFETNALRSSMSEMGCAPYEKERYARICADKESFVIFGANEARPNVWPYYPDMPTERMLAQKGIHTFSEQPLCDYAKLIGKSLMNDRMPDRNASPLVKLIIPWEAKAALREYLIQIDIHASTLFPGLDGIGGTISEMLELEISAYLQRHSEDMI